MPRASFLNRSCRSWGRKLDTKDQELAELGIGSGVGIPIEDLRLAGTGDILDGKRLS
uniref:Uncharacterized protein n=1 Tax=Picea glauca TaxID=3330 RepID=A0A101LW42_PICGL|nr:hypothetical protein ABT39_MTgene1521 [Picea glauca]